MKIKINHQELEFKFKFKQLKELCNVTGKELTELEAITSNLNSIALIASLGTGKSIEEIETLLDEDGTFDAVQGIVKAFSEEVVQYFSPNSQSQTN